MQARPHEIRSKFERSRFRRRLLSVSALFMAASIFVMAGGGSAERAVSRMALRLPRVSGAAYYSWAWWVSPGRLWIRMLHQRQ